MYSKRHFITLMIFAIATSFALGQQKHIVIEKKIHNGDSLSVHGQEDHEVQIQIIADSLHDHFKWSHSEGVEIFNDSAFKNIFVHKMPMHTRNAARIVIKKSGFFRKSKIVIDFDPMTKGIIKIVDDGEEVPAKKFHKYQDYLEDASDFAELEALHPRIEELELKLEGLELPNPEMLADLESLIVNLEGLESKKAHLERQKFTLMKHVFELEKLEGVVQGILEEAGVTPPQKIETISIKNGKFFINDEEIKGEVGEKCLQAYLEHSDLSQEDLDKKREEISIDIRFD